MSLYLPQALMSVALPVLLLVLFIVGVVRSGGVPRILLAVAAMASGISIVLIPFAPQVADSIGFAGYGMLAAVPNVVSGICTGVALIIGRPGVPTQPSNLGGYPPATGYPGYPPAPGYQAGAPRQE